MTYYKYISDLFLTILRLRWGIITKIAVKSLSTPIIQVVQLICFGLSNLHLKFQICQLYFRCRLQIVGQIVSMFQHQHHERNEACTLEQLFKTGNDRQEVALNVSVLFYISSTNCVILIAPIANFNLQIYMNTIDNKQVGQVVLTEILN